jgi:hypothetical protein
MLDGQLKHGHAPSVMIAVIRTLSCNADGGQIKERQAVMHATVNFSLKFL